MIADLKPYPEYRESGQAWLGKVPEHWHILPNRAIFTEVKDRNHPQEEMLSVTINKGVIQQKVLLENSSKKDSSNQDKSAYKLVCPGDIAYNKMRAWQGAIGASAFRGIISPAYIVMRLRESQNPLYFHYLYRTPHFAKEAERWSYGITSDMWSLRPEHFKMIYTPLPPLHEQAAIVRFLDHVNRRIERTILAKRKVITLLNEQKQVIIHQAVTRGLNPNVRMKPSGIPWLGEIPEGWEKRKMKHLVATVGGMTPNKGEERFWNGTIPWVSPKDMKVRELFDSKDHIADAAIKQTSISLINPPAVLIVVRGMILARTFPTALTKVPLTINQDMKALLPRPNLEANYLAYLLTGIQRELLNLVEESGHGTCCLRTDSWANFSLPLPPVSEQASICSHLNTELTGLSSLISHTERGIEFLREYRTRLTTDVVTGKLDVREAAQRLPEELEDGEEPLEDETDDATVEETEE